MYTTTSEAKVKPKKKPRIVPQRHPSASRLESQDRIINGRIADAKKLIHSYPLFKNSVKPESENDHAEPELSDSDTIPYIPDPDPSAFEESKQHISPLAKKGKLVTKTFSVKKPGKNVSGCKYKCTKCKGVYVVQPRSCLS